MNKDEQKAVAREFKGLFPKATDEQILLLNDKWKDFGYRVVLAALKTHAMNNEFLNIPNLIEGIRAEHRRATESGFRHETIAQGLRRMARTTWGIPGYEDLPDRDVIVMHYYGCWEKVRDSDIHESGRKFIRKWIKGLVIDGMLQLGETEEAAKEYATLVVEETPNERSAKDGTSETVSVCGLLTSDGGRSESWSDRQSDRAAPDDPEHQ